MVWLITHIWMALAIAGILGLLFGFSVRGLTGGSKIRRAEVERDVAQTELQQTKTELDALYAAQRKAREGGQGVATASPVSAELKSELTKLRDENSGAMSRIAELELALEDAKSDTSKGVTAGVSAAAGAGVAALVGGSDEQDLKDRNQWLEDRVAVLEGDVAKLPALEAKLSDAEQQLAAIPAERDAAETEEELAKLRWRNRYLEGRLAYFEEGSQAVDESEAVSAETDDASVANDVPEDEAIAEDASVHPSDAVLQELEPGEEEGVEAEEDSETNTESAPDMDANTDEGDDEGDTDMAAPDLEMEKPTTTSKPSTGGDDLGAIDGIGPRIAEVLNGLGIWTYEQIAGWDEKNANWVDDHLAFNGRVGQQNWIDQAKALLEKPGKTT